MTKFKIGDYEYNRRVAEENKLKYEEKLGKELARHWYDTISAYRAGQKSYVFNTDHDIKDFDLAIRIIQSFAKRNPNHRGWSIQFKKPQWDDQFGTYVSITFTQNDDSFDDDDESSYY